MRLLRLSANQASFREVKFLENGPTIILGKQKSQKEKKKESTYNGVGKSLLLYLVNFCLGSQAKEELGEKLPKWSFSLEFRIGTEAHTVTRSTSEQDKVIFDGTELTLDKFRDWLESRAFHLTKKIPYLTFRSLIGLFLRPGKSAYQTFDRLHFSESPYQRLVRNAFLLGLDTDLIRAKFDIREELEKIKEMKSWFLKDPIISDYFLGSKDLNIALKEQGDALAKLEDDYKTFKVAENYKEVEEEANEYRRQIQTARNEVYLLDSSVAQIQESLRQRVTVGLTKLEELYAACKVKLPEIVVKELREVAEFHKGLVQKRQERLEAELKQACSKVKAANVKVESLNSELNNRLKFLNGHGAFSEYVALSEKLNEKKAEYQKLLDFKKLTKEYKDRERDLKLKLSEENIKASKYLEEHEQEINEVTETFRMFAKRVYPEKASGLVITNNEGDNQSRFDIEAKIISDASDGINEVKIFCFDMTVLLSRKTHNVNFLFHDSRLFSDIDPRQRTELFKIAHEHTKRAGVQYIATINEDQIEAMKEWMSPEDYKAVILDSVTLELTDDSAAGKLLGIDVDLDYDKSDKG